MYEAAESASRDASSCPQAIEGTGDESEEGTGHTGEHGTFVNPKTPLPPASPSMPTWTTPKSTSSPRRSTKSHTLLWAGDVIPRVLVGPEKLGIDGRTVR